MNIKVNCTIEEGMKLPQYESIGASGMDVMAYKYALPPDAKTTYELPFTLKPFERVMIKTGLRVELPADKEIQVRPRSGLAFKNGISIVNTPGTCDEDYRGDIGVILINLGKEDFVINKGDKIAQIVFMNVDKAKLIPNNKLNETKRGESGFGSTTK